VAERSDLPVWVEALGTVVPAATVTVRPQVNGVLKQVLYREGDLVRAGQVLATIDPASFEMALMQARGQRLRDEAQLQNARLTLQRFQTLLQQDSIARQDVDTQAALVRQLEAAIVSDKAAEGTAQLNLSYTKITAPISGRVGLRPVDAGNLVSTSDTGGIATITQVTPIDVSFNLPQDRVPDVQARVARSTPMNAIALDRARVNELDQGRFLTMDNQIDVQTGTVKAKARFANAKGTLFPNQFVNLRLLLDTVNGAVTVPVTALRQRSQGAFVYVIQQDRTVKLQPVTRGLATADKVAITSGLQPGERVVTEGADRLRDGARVALPGERPASGAFAARGARGASAASGAGHGRRQRTGEAATP
jgi:multidrug efflux system membrane fusion protein